MEADMPFTAVYLNKDGDHFSAELKHLADDVLDNNPLSEGEVVVRIAHSGINYKDGLAIANRSPVVRGWPMVAGIDGAGTVESSSDARWKAGDRVVVTGWGLGETHWGCLAQRARLKADWLIELPRAFSTLAAMSLGTAGFTAMLSCVAARDAGVEPATGDVLVTGASGGVGSVAVAILSAWGYRVVAATGKPHEADYLRSLGAAEILDRASLSSPGKPLQKERWAAVVDSVGSHTLANACAQTRYGGVVTACGLAQGMDFPTSVAPFILRGVKLFGIDSVMCPMERRKAAWDALASAFDNRKLEAITTVIGLGDVFATADQILSGQVRGRTVVDVHRVP
jgi:acrylyl-CoA reductase (NADPH)